MTDLVWYAAFGSNVSAERFTTYLTGGLVPFSPAGRVQRGSRDPSPPRANRVMRIPHRLLFGRSSAGWGGGGVAFLDPTPDQATDTLVRCWLITAQQFDDVFAQENGRADVVTIDREALDSAGRLDLLDSWYGTVLRLAPSTGPEQAPVLTFTCADAGRVPLRPAHPSYLRALGSGLMSGWGLTPEEAARYLASRGGNQGFVDPESLSTDLASLGLPPGPGVASRP